MNALLRDGRVTRLLPPRVRRETGRQFVTRVLREQRDGEGVSFAVRPLGSREVIGQIRLLNWSRSERTAEVGYWFRRKYWGRGFATDALRLTCRFGFAHMSLHRLEAIAVVGNVGSRRVLEHVGFRLEGRGRRAARLSGCWADEWRFGLLRGEMRS
ncbi:MAG: GNAT family N-acetyltransferase [Thermoplasmata archaeon]|nr:GNAT family N-acetyltransferase [Thermoplasmata archaeon]